MAQLLFETLNPDGQRVVGKNDRKSVVEVSVAEERLKKLRATEMAKSIRRQMIGPDA